MTTLQSAQQAVQFRSPLPLRGEVDADSPALFTSDGTTLSHGDLRERVDSLVQTLPDVRHGRLLTHLRLTPIAEDLIAYFALLEAGHVALLLPSSRSETLEAAWPADLVRTDDGFARTDPARETPRHLLHPDLAVLLSTSGSTGSPKLVRLSHTNIVSNAEAIASALQLNRSDRGVTSLPLHYCFGLSVIHSHLTVGASVSLTEASVLDPQFWDTVDDGVTNIAVVPHMVELMEGTGVLNDAHPSLRLLAQAGGRMSPERITRTAKLGERHGWGLAVMYGQSEATARIAVQPPERTVVWPDSVGLPVPGTRVRLDADVPEADEKLNSGEIVVSGPGVMLGYAEHPDDLAMGQMVTELRTGDLGVLDDDGSLRIVGRRSGFVKVLGLRIDLARVEAALEYDGLIVCVTGDDSGLRVAVEPDADAPNGETASRARALAAKACGIGVGHVRVAVLPLARLANGKVDRAGCDVLVRAVDPEECSDARQRIDAPSTAMRAAAVLRDVLGRDEVDLELSFVAQGGDSLSHVKASVELSAVLGELPRDWHHRPVMELIDSSSGDRGSSTATGGKSPRWRQVETSVVLRAIAAIIICGSHAELFRLLGGAHTLMVVAGFSAALFGLSAAGSPDRWRATGRFLVGIAVPTMIAAAVGMAYGRYHWGNLLLINWATGEAGALRRNELWFVDALILCILLVTAVLSVRPLARRWRTDPYRVAMGLAIAGLASRWLILTVFDGTIRGLMPTVFWLFAIGLALAHANTWRRRAWTLAAAMLGAWNFFPDDLARNAMILGGILVLGLARSVRIPTVAVPLLSLLAAASLHIYLVQFHVQALIDHPLAGTVVSLAAGVLAWRLTARPLHRLQDLIFRQRTAASLTQTSERTPS